MRIIGIRLKNQCKEAVFLERWRKNQSVFYQCLLKQNGILLPKSHINFDTGIVLPASNCVPILIEAV